MYNRLYLFNMEIKIVNNKQIHLIIGLLPYSLTRMNSGKMKDRRFKIVDLLLVRVLTAFTQKIRQIKGL